MAQSAGRNRSARPRSTGLRSTVSIAPAIGSRNRLPDTADAEGVGAIDPRLLRQHYIGGNRSVTVLWPLLEAGATRPRTRRQTGREVLGRFRYGGAGRRRARGPTRRVRSRPSRRLSAPVQPTLYSLHGLVLASEYALDAAEADPAATPHYRFRAGAPTGSTTSPISTTACCSG